VVAPGAVHLPGWLTAAEQRALVVACRRWARPPGGLRTVTLPAGGTMSVQIVCLGWDWTPYRYRRTLADGTPVKPFPPELGRLGRRAVADATGMTEMTGTGVEYDPDVALVNYYRPDARMGMHRDREERVGAPVVSLSLGDAAVFRFGNPRTRNRPWVDVKLASGDLFVFGGESRWCYHGVTRLLPDTAPAGCGIAGGRLNITLRVSGLTEAR
jgi:alkylated DNA repair protein (DNA oxidative demethylase)